MSRYRQDDPEEDLDQLPTSRFKVTVEFTLSADCVDDAESEISNLIKEGILALAGLDDTREINYDYDITDTESAEFI